MNRIIPALGAAAVLAAAAIITMRPEGADDSAPPTPDPGAAMVEISVPPLTGNAVIGKRIFDSFCTACHGENATGRQGSGPPLIHVIYEPGHHADEAFQRAVARGVRSHHWPFGDMPRIEGLTRGDVAMVISYIRSIQRENGIN